MVRKDLQLKGRLYSIILPPPTQALPLCNRAVVLLGAFAPLFSDIKTLGDEKQTKEARMMLVLGKLGDAVRNVDPDASFALMMDCVAAGRLSVEGTEGIFDKISFDKHFEDKRSDIYPVLLWCLWESISDFFPQSGIFTRILSGLKDGASKSPEDGSTTGG